MHFRSVVLPEPLSPIKDMISPFLTEKFSFFISGRPFYKTSINFLYQETFVFLFINLLKINNIKLLIMTIIREYTLDLVNISSTANS